MSEHKSDCSLHDAPALKPIGCTCGAILSGPFQSHEDCLETTARYHENVAMYERRAAAAMKARAERAEARAEQAENVASAGKPLGMDFRDWLADGKPSVCMHCGSLSRGVTQMRQHTVTCEANPANQRAEAAEAKVATLEADLNSERLHCDAAQRAYQSALNRAVTAEARLAEVGAVVEAAVRHERDMDDYAWCDCGLCAAVRAMLGARAGREGAT